MEERIIDKEDSRKIKLKRTQEGETDAVDGVLPEGDAEAPQEEFFLELPEEDYDEDLVGLTPSQLQAELERRERARREAIAESARLYAEAEERMQAGDFVGAEPFFAQAALYDPDNAEARKGLWRARTRGFKELDGLLIRDIAEEVSEDAEAQALIIEKMGDALKEERKTLKAEEAEIAPRVEGKQAERRKAFADNRNYYLVRFLILLGCFAAMVVGSIVSASFIYTTKSASPIVCTIVFGVLALIIAGIEVYFGRKLLVASRLCRDNEKLSSTEEGARLKVLRERIENLDLILGD